MPVETSFPPPDVAGEGEVVASLVITGLTPNRPVSTDGTNLLVSTADWQYAASTDTVYDVSVTGDSVKRFTLKADGSFNWGSGSAAQSVSVAYDGTGILAQRKVGQSQAYRIYNEYVDASNYSRLTIEAAASIGTYIRQERAGTGNIWPLIISNTTTAGIDFYSNNTKRWSVAPSGDWLPDVDNATDIGKNGAMIRSLYAGTNLNFGVQAIGPVGSVSAPSYTFTGVTTTGIYLNQTNGNRITFTVAGADIVAISPAGTAAGLVLRGSQPLGWSSTTDVTSAPDVRLWRGGAAGVLQQSNTTNAQQIRIYNTTDSDAVPVNFEFIRCGYNSSIAEFTSRSGGSGTARAIRMGVNAQQWEISTNGYLLGVTDNTYDIGASGATRPRTVYAGTSMIVAVGSASAVSYGFQAQINSGMYNASSRVCFALAGTFLGLFRSTGFMMSSSAAIGWLSGTVESGTEDLKLLRAGAGVLQQSNTTNAQSYYLYNTTDSDTTPANYERLILSWAANVAFVRTAAGGSGTARQLVLDGASSLTLQSAATSRWTVTSSGHFVAGADNTYDIGASGATRPRSLYWGTTLGGPLGDATTPMLSIAATPGVGFFFTSGSNGFGFSTSAGNERMRFDATGLGMVLGASFGYMWSSTAASSGTTDLKLWRGAAGTLSQSNTTNAQVYRLYGTTDSDSAPANYERFEIITSAGTTVLRQTQLGTGTARSLQIGPTGSAQIQFTTNGTISFVINNAGHLLDNVDNTNDIGASGASRPRNIYPGTSVTFSTTGALAWSTDLFLRRAGAGILSQSNTTSVQTHYIYNTTDSDTSPVNYERLAILCGAASTVLQQQQGGTGVARGMEIGTAGSATVSLSVAGSVRWQVQTTFHLFPNGDNQYDIGSASARPRSLYAGTSIINSGPYLGLPTGCVSFATAAQATNATTGWLTIPSCSGTPTGVPANVPTGQVAMTYDTAANKVYVYNGGWKRAQVTAVDAIYA